MINQTEINKLREVANNENALAALLDKWENNLKAKDLASGKKIEINVAYKDSESGYRTILAVPFCGGLFAFHKMEATTNNSRKYTITHTPSGRSIANNCTLANVKKAAVFIEERFDDEFRKILDSAETSFMHHMTQEHKDLMWSARSLGMGGRG